MTVKIFVLGDSFCYHDLIEIDQSWPYVLSTLGDYTVYNGAVPGSSNDSLFHRYLQMEKLYGKPDITIALITYMNRFWYQVQGQPILGMDQITSNYHVTQKHNYKNTTVSFVGFGDAFWENRLVGYTGIDIDTFKSYYAVQHQYHIEEWQTKKEIYLLNSYVKNCVFMSWDIDFTALVEDMNIQYIGSVENIMRNSYKTHWLSATDNHFNPNGHAKLAMIIANKIQKYI